MSQGCTRLQCHGRADGQDIKEFSVIEFKVQVTPSRPSLKRNACINMARHSAQSQELYNTQNCRNSHTQSNTIYKVKVAELRSVSMCLRDQLGRQAML